MKNKVKQALKSLLEEVAVHESETQHSAVGVDLGDLKRVLRWAQNSAYVWFEGDRVVRTGVSVNEFPWLTRGMEGTALSDSDDGGRVRVEWDGGLDGNNRAMMFHNEIKKLK